MAALEDGTTILFYKYIIVEDPDAEKTKQLQLWENLNMTGRMRVSREGINANLYGSVAAISQYKEAMEASALWRGIEYKHSPSNLGDPFDGMRRIRVSNEITGTGPMRHFLPTALGGEGGEHLSAEAFDEVVRKAQDKESDYVVIDTRNHYETVVGKFKGAVDPKLRCFAQFPSWVEANEEKLRGKKVALYCTGGIRCEKASAYVKSLNLASDVYQLKGGIHSYLEQFSPHAKPNGVYVDRREGAEEVKENDGYLDEDECQFEGINFQFDNRFSDQAVGVGKDVTIGRCTYCFKPQRTILDHARCNICTDFLLICEGCLARQDELRGKDDNGLVIIYCPEHRLLGDDWKEFLEQLQWTPKELDFAKRSLIRLLDVSEDKVRNGSKSQGRRKQNLRLQIERIEEWQREHSKEALSAGAPEEERNIGDEEFIPFVPFLNP